MTKEWLIFVFCSLTFLALEATVGGHSVGGSLLVYATLSMPVPSHPYTEVKLLPFPSLLKTIP